MSILLLHVSAVKCGSINRITISCACTLLPYVCAIWACTSTCTLLFYACAMRLYRYLYSSVLCLCCTSAWYPLVYPLVLCLCYEVVPVSVLFCSMPVLWDCTGACNLLFYACDIRLYWYLFSFVQCLWSKVVLVPVLFFLMPVLYCKAVPVPCATR